MVGRLYDYNGKIQLLRIVKKTPMESTEATYQNGSLSMINKSYNTNGTVFFDTLKDNDVICIYSNGVVKKIYDSNSKNIDLLLTSHCNSSCVMCPMSEQSRQADEKGYLSWLKELISILPSDLNRICLTGGEPTMIGDDFIQILDLVRKKFNHASFQLLTNGRSMSDFSFCSKVVEHLPNYTSIGIPLHAGTNALHERIAQVNDSYDQVIQGIKNLLIHNQRVELRVVVSKLNIKDMKNLATLVVDELPQVDNVVFMGLEMMGNAIKNKDYVWLDYIQSFSYLKEPIDILCKAGINVLIYNYPLCAVDEKYWFLTKKSITPSKVRYFEECSFCSVKEACGGFFVSTFKTMDIAIRPIG